MITGLIIGFFVGMIFWYYERNLRRTTDDILENVRKDRDSYMEMYKNVYQELIKSVSPHGKTIKPLNP